MDDLALLVALRTLLVHVEPPHLRERPRHALTPSPSGGRRRNAREAERAMQRGVSGHCGNNTERRPHRRRIAKALAALRRPLCIVGVLRLAAVLHLGPGLLAHGGQATEIAASRLAFRDYRKPTGTMARRLLEVLRGQAQVSGQWTGLYGRGSDLSGKQQMLLRAVVSHYHRLSVNTAVMHEHG